MKFFSNKSKKVKKPKAKTKKTISVNTRVSSALFVLLLFILITAAGSWYIQQKNNYTINNLINIGIESNNEVKNSYIYVQQAVSKINAAISIANADQRNQELDASKKLIEKSRENIEQLKNSKALSGSSEADNLMFMLNVTYNSYWDMLDSLMEYAANQDYENFESLKRGSLLIADINMMRVFGQFEKYMQNSNATSRAELGQISQWFEIGLISLIVLAIIISLLVRRTLISKIIRPLHLAQRHLQKIAAGDLDVNIYPKSNDEIGSLLANMKNMRDSLDKIISSIRDHMFNIHTSASQIDEGNTNLSSRTDQQASSLQQTAASMEELASTVKQNADNAKQANQLANSASAVAARGGQAVQAVVTTMQGISASSQKISDIVTVIDSIAFQTNILALNAAVEAARAGEQGRGFAVVAGEVRALAQRSASAAKEVKELINDSVNRVVAGSDQVKGAGATMQEIVSAVTRVSDIMGEITAASVEQSSGIDQINMAISQMDTVTQQNAQLVQDAAIAASSLRELTEDVSQELAVFNLPNNKQLATTKLSSDVAAQNADKSDKSTPETEKEMSDASLEAKEKTRLAQLSAINTDIKAQIEKPTNAGMPSVQKNLSTDTLAANNDSTELEWKSF